MVAVEHTCTNHTKNCFRDILYELIECLNHINVPVQTHVSYRLGKRSLPEHCDPLLLQTAGDLLQASHRHDSK